MATIEIGRLLRANTKGCIMGCWVTQLAAPKLGALVRIPLDSLLQCFGIIYDIHIDDDSLVRQLLSADQIDTDVLDDNRTNRNVPVEISILFVGYQQGEFISHLLPPKPPLILDTIFLCNDEEICQFTKTGKFGYFRHILRADDLPVEEILTAHLQQANRAHCEAQNPNWINFAMQELISMLRDDYTRLMNVLGTVADAQW